MKRALRGARTSGRARAASHHRLGGESGSKSELMDGFGDGHFDAVAPGERHRRAGGGHALGDMPQFGEDLGQRLARGAHRPHAAVAQAVQSW